MTHEATFSPAEVGVALSFGLLIEVALFLLIALAQSTLQIQEDEEDVKKEVPIAVKPMLDEVPLLKLGGKRVRAKLPDMWRKKPPIKRYKATSAPSPQAGKNVEDIPDTPLSDAAPPPPDAKLAKEVDEMLDTDAAAKELNIDEEGAADGVKEGTETDPLKARAISQYQMKILAWFNSRFRPPAGQIDCSELKNLSASVVANVGQQRQVTGYSIRRPSGNPIFDSKVKSTMDAIVGQELPPPPPLYPDILGTSVLPVFSGKSACK